ncbi:MAG: hypothetical protein AAF399_30095 [Bacteroidota bacterium]
MFASFFGIEHFHGKREIIIPQMIRLSPHGRATVVRLQLNRSGLIERRRVLVSAGLHPP